MKNKLTKPLCEAALREAAISLATTLHVIVWRVDNNCTRKLWEAVEEAEDKIESFGSTIDALRFERVIPRRRVLDEGD